VLCDRLDDTRFKLDDASACCEIMYGSGAREGEDASGLTEFI